ncbi:MAG: hypothetical protein JXB00_18020 [Bacteroidales bacterium]|nr:hypothetical protein [Bacteroidales bacterium]
MKKQILLKTYVLILFSLTGYILSGCEKEDDAPARDQFLGVFTVVESCGSGNDTYEIIIMESGTNANAIIINNLYDWEESASASISGNNVTIPSQLLDGITFSGSGSISGNTLTINLSVSTGDASDNCNLICTRK